jgi:hypothetical protein
MRKDPKAKIIELAVQAVAAGESAKVEEGFGP